MLVLLLDGVVFGGMWRMRVTILTALVTREFVHRRVRMVVDMRVAVRVRSNDCGDLGCAGTFPVGVVLER